MTPSGISPKQLLGLKNTMKKFLYYVLIAGLVVGTLDILAAFLLFFINTGNPQVFIVLKFIASGFFGKAALLGGTEMVLAGLLFHFMIATTFSLVFFLLFGHLRRIFKNLLLLGATYGLFVWSVMNLLVVPLSKIGSRPFDFTQVAINIFILMVCIGIPLAYLANNFHSRKA
jgi:uncharacterized membrane protein YagU involved in acid resistance